MKGLYKKWIDMTCPDCNASLTDDGHCIDNCLAYQVKVLNEDNERLNRLLRFKTQEKIGLLEMKSKITQLEEFNDFMMHKFLDEGRLIEEEYKEYQKSS